MANSVIGTYGGRNLSKAWKTDFPGRCIWQSPSQESDFCGITNICWVCKIQAMCIPHWEKSFPPGNPEGWWKKPSPSHRQHSLPGHEGEPQQAITPCRLRISTSRGKPQAVGRGSSRASLQTQMAQISHGGSWDLAAVNLSVCAWCRGTGKELQSASSSQQQAVSTFHMTQLATPSEQINNGIFWRQAGKCCWLGTAPHGEMQRCYLCRKQHTCLVLSQQRGQMWPRATSYCGIIDFLLSSMP